MTCVFELVDHCDSSIHVCFLDLVRASFLSSALLDSILSLFASFDVFEHLLIHETLRTAWTYELEQLDEVFKSPVHIDRLRSCLTNRTSPWPLAINASFAEEHTAILVVALSTLNNDRIAKFADKVVNYAFEASWSKRRLINDDGLHF